MFKFALTLAGALLLGQAASAQQACFAQNMCDFRGFACVSDVEDCQSAKIRLRRDVARAQSKAQKMRKSLAHLEAANTALKAQLADAGTQEQWARERGKVMGDYTLLLICVRDATTLEAAKTCGEG